MPLKIRKIRNKDLYKVINTETKEVHSKGSSKEDAKRQVRLLNAIDHGFVPTKMKGGASMNPIVSQMINYLKTLYPVKTLHLIGLEILKLTNHKISGGSRSTKITNTAKYIIGVIGTTLAITVAMILLSYEKEEENKPIQPIQPYVRPSNSLYDVFNKPYDNLKGGAMNSTVKRMVDYLKMLYPAKTLHSVANEILKLAGHKAGGMRGGKSTSAYSIAKYVIATIGVALAIAVAVFLLSQDKNKYVETLPSPIKASNEIFNTPANEPVVERKRIVSVFDDPNSEAYKERERYRQIAKEPIIIPPSPAPRLPAPKPAPAPKPIPKGQSASNKSEVQRTRERLAEIAKRDAKNKADMDRQKLMNHLYND